MKKFKTAIEFDSLTNKRVFASVFLESNQLIYLKEKKNMIYSEKLLLAFQRVNCSVIKFESKKTKERGT